MATKIIIFSLILMGLVGCAPTEIRWRNDAGLLHEQLRMTDAGKLLPDEFRSLEETLNSGEMLLNEGNKEAATEFYRLALTKGLLFKQNMAMKKERQAKAAQLKASIKQDELKRLKAIQEQQLRLEKEAAEATTATQTQDKIEKSQPIIEKQLSAYHTVKRGETLPQIAAQTDVYNDPTLWPLLYRANRDQISDPQQVWPGQALRIPRNSNQNDIAKARHYAKEHPLH